MAKKNKKQPRPKARLPKGMRDIPSFEVNTMSSMLETIRSVYQSYGFDALDTPVFEYSDALGKQLPDQDRPNEGVFSFEDEDGQWLSLRYDLTAPLARYVAEHYDILAKPLRRYQTGFVFRNEKPGPGRFRQFTQFDADTVGTASVAADAELCMLAADTMEKLGIGRGMYTIRVNNRKILDGVLAVNDIDPASTENELQRLTVLRAIDKLDRLGLEGVELLLGAGRKDESGAYTKGAGLAESQIKNILAFVDAGGETRQDVLNQLEPLVGNDETGQAGIAELAEMDGLLSSAGYGTDQVVFDPGIVRGLAYYTGPVFEAELNFQKEDEDGNQVRFGSVGGGGRYDGLVARFKGIEVPATGFSIGVSRLYSALQHLDKAGNQNAFGPVIVMVMDMERKSDYYQMVQKLRKAGIRAEMYMGTSGMKAQMKYADKRNAPCVVIQGSDELERGEIMIKDLVEGSKLSEKISDNKEWRESRPAQFSVPVEELVSTVQQVLARYDGELV